jgi:hypothetical protein
MLEYLMISANIAGLAGCVYAAYAMARACSARADNARRNLARDDAGHELFFRKPCADYNI